MALRTTVRPRPAAGRAPAPARELTIEEARREHASGTLALAVAELKEKSRLDDIAREHTNSANRQDTQAAKAIRAYVVAQDLQPEDELQIADSGYRYDVTHSEKIEAKDLYQMLKDGKITDGEFLRSIIVSKTEAEKAIGAHKLLKITKTTDGKKADIRKRKLDTPVKEPTIIRAANKVEPKLKLSQQEAPVQRSATSVSKIRPGRKLTLKR